MASKTRKTLLDLEKEVAAFNEKNPVGTSVQYWPGERRGEGRESTTRTKAYLLGNHTPVVWVVDHPACIALTHVLPI